MIHYKRGGTNLIRNILAVRGSVFPTALKISVPSAIITSILVSLIYDWGFFPHFREDGAVMNNNAIWAGFSFLVGFLVVFRTSQAYARFWEGVHMTHKMGANWYNCCASLIAFSRRSNADQDLVLHFQGTIVRLFSMLHAVAMGEVEDTGGTHDHEHVAAFRMELIDGTGVDTESLRAVRDSEAKVELIFQWVQQLIVDNMDTGVLDIPAPILTRAFQELAEGMVCLSEALTISKTPFPFPYAVTCDCMLLLHWLIVPFVVSQWCKHPFWAFIFSFIQVFTLWSLNMIAVELENPFGSDPNDIDGRKLHAQMNVALRLLCRSSTKRIPRMTAVSNHESPLDVSTRVSREPRTARVSLYDLWERSGEVERVRRPSAANSSVGDLSDLDDPPVEMTEHVQITPPAPDPTGVWEPCNRGGDVARLRPVDRECCGELANSQRLSPRSQVEAAKERLGIRDRTDSGGMRGGQADGYGEVARERSRRVTFAETFSTSSLTTTVWWKRLTTSPRNRASASTTEQPPGDQSDSICI